MSAIFVTIATVKFKYIPKFYTSVILPIARSKEIREKQFSVFGSSGGHDSPLMHLPLLISCDKLNLTFVLLYY